MSAEPPPRPDRLRRTSEAAVEAEQDALFHDNPVRFYNLGTAD